ncbi:MAG: PAS domain-containing protein [Moraxellaceae bacterium]|nr:PAS domain-containing protein [Moraxellaceae bacterium]
MNSVPPVRPAVTTSDPAEVSAFLQQVGDALELGAPENWPAPVRVLVELMAVANQAMFLTWGAERRIVYNARYAEIMGSRHPAGFGQPFAEVWADVLMDVWPILDRTYHGQSTAMDDIGLWFEQDGRREERHFSFSYSPVRDLDGTVGGAFCACMDITATVLTERAVASGHARQLRLFAKAPSFIAILQGPQHVYEFVNEAYTRLVGGRACVGLSVSEALPEIARQGIIGLLDGVYREGRRYTASGMRVQLQSAEDQPVREHYLDFVYEPMIDDAGKVTGIFVEGFDVTEAHVARRAEEAASGRYRDLLTTMSEGFLMLDDEQRIVEANEAALAMGERTRAEVIGRRYIDVWPNALGTPIEAAYRRAVAERVPVSLEYACRPNHELVWMDIRIYPVKDGLAAFYRDVTQLRRASTALKYSHDRFQAAVQAIGVMWTSDAAGRMHAPQPGWSELTGQSPQEYEGEGWASALHPEDVQPTLQAWNEAVSKQTGYLHEHRVRRSDGQWRLFSIKAQPVRDSDGKVIEWVGVHVDITEARKDAEALRAADRQKDEFLAVLAHELRNPLAPIRNAAQILAAPALTREHLAMCREVIARQIGHMAMLLDDLLDVSRITRGRFELRKAYVSLRSVIDNAVETARPLIERKGHTLGIALPAHEVTLEVDPLRLSQSLTNLLTNAAKYTDEGGRIDLSAAVLPAGELEVQVRDNGIGLAADFLERVFDMFAQVGTAGSRAEGGLGIGLALTRGLVELHGGRINAYSSGLGAGASFTILLPAELVHVTDPQVTHVTPTSDGEPGAALGVRVLIADDNRDAAESLALLLRLSGYVVETASDGQSALAACARSHPRFALLDIGMPDMNGYELARRLRREAWGRAMSLGAVTGWGQDDDKREALAAGFDAHFTKPIDPAALMAWMSEAQTSGTSDSAAAI